MNSKKVNWSFLIAIIGTLVLQYSAPFFSEAVLGALGDLTLGNLVTEGIILLPILVFALLSKDKLGELLGFHKIKISSALMIVVFCFVSMPVITLFNLISQIWVSNTVSEAVSSFHMEQMSFGKMFLTMAVIAPIMEEVISRGFYYRSYRKSGGALKALFLSAILFAFLHMNFNQALYAFVMGMMAVLLVEVTGSLWSSVLYHGLINGSQVFLIYTQLRANPEVYAEASITSDYIIYMIAVFLVITAVTLPLAWAVLVWLGNNEGRSGVLSAIWRDKQKKDKLVTVPLVLALILCILEMTGVLLYFYYKLVMHL